MIFDTVSRSWEITKLSFSVIRQDMELLLFPLLGGIASILFVAAMLVPSLAIQLMDEATWEGFPVLFVMRARKRAAS